MNHFVEIQPYDSDHPILINIDYLVKIEPTYYGSDVYLATGAVHLEQIRCCTNYNNWATILSAR